MNEHWPIQAKENIFKKTKTHRETCSHELGEISKFCFLVAKIKMVSYSEFEIKFSPLLIKFLLN